MFNFDYKQDLLHRAVDRERLFVLRTFMPDPDMQKLNEGDEEGEQAYLEAKANINRKSVTAS